MNIDESLTAKGFTPAAQVPLVYGGPRTIESITIHHWGAFGQTHSGVNNFFVNGPGGTSCHFVSSGAGGTHCLVSPGDAAWHAGNATGNRTSVGIECRPEADESDYREVAKLIAWLRSQYGDLPLIPHRDWQATACPGIWDLKKLDRMARGEDITVAPQAAPAAPVPAPQPLAQPGAGQCRVDPGDTLSGIAVQFGVDLNDLIRINGITEPDKIFPGMILDLPEAARSFSQCVVDPGDTLSGIAAQFGISMDRILTVNPGINPDLIYPGQVLNL